MGGKAKRLVVCAAAVACFAASTAIASAAPTTWELQHTPNPRDFQSVVALSCTSPSWCLAINASFATFPNEPFATRWDGHTWKRTRPLVATGEHVLTEDVACTNPTFCLAVGQVNWDSDSPADPPTALVERWDGTRWSKVKNPAGARHSHINLVACTSATDCLLTGYEFDDDHHELGLTEHWNGSALALVVPPTEGLEVRELACASATRCFGVTNEVGFVLPLEAWDGENWSRIEIPAPDDSRLDALSCASPTSCVGVGYVGHTRNGLLVETWNGTSWSRQPTPKQVPDHVVALSCASPTNCTAVGSIISTASRPHDFLGYIATWNGTNWTRATVPQAGDSDNFLEAVSCAPGTDWCIAGGSWEHDRDNIRILSLLGTSP